MARNRVLVVDDEPGVRFGLREFLEAKGFDVDEAATCQAGGGDVQEPARRTWPSSTTRCPTATPWSCCRGCEALDATVPQVILPRHGSIDLAVRAVKEGAEHFLTKPVELPALLVILRRADRGPAQPPARRSRGGRREARRAVDPFALPERRHPRAGGGRGAGGPLRQPRPHPGRDRASARGCSRAGCTSTGPRAEEAFVDLNCASLSRELLETELFGHEKGAFTGAVAAKEGLLEVAHRGTLFLDEIGDVDPAVQPKLLKVLEEGRFRRLGDVRDREVDVRLIAATHQDLAAAVREKRFRSDLYFRISALPLRHPAAARAAGGRRRCWRSALLARIARRPRPAASCRSRRRRWRPSRPTPGRATPASCATCWSAPRILEPRAGPGRRATCASRRRWRRAAPSADSQAHAGGGGAPPHRAGPRRGGRARRARGPPAGRAAQLALRADQAPGHRAAARLNGASAMAFEKYRVRDGRKFRLKDHDPADTGGFESKEQGKARLEPGLARLRELQDKLYAQDRWARAADLPGHGRRGQGQHHQARDVRREPAGLPGLLVQGALGRGARPRLPVAHQPRACPSAAASASSTARTTRRCWSCACTRDPRRGRSCRRSWSRTTSGRSASRTSATSSATWRATASLIRKFFLNVSKEEQKQRFLARLDEPEKNWKFSLGDVEEREHWDHYMDAYEDMIRAHQHRATRRGTSSPPTTSGSRAWWWRTPSWTRWRTSSCEYPEVDEAKKKELKAARELADQGMTLLRWML